MKKLLLATVLMLMSFSVSAVSVSITNPSVMHGSGILLEVITPNVQYTFGGDFFGSGEIVALSWDSKMSGASLDLIDFTVSTTLADWSLSIFDGLNETVLTSGNAANTSVSSLFTMTGGTVYSIIMTGTAAITSFAVGFTYPLSVAEVPLPATLWLFGSVLLGGLSLLRRRSEKLRIQSVVT
ncbi:MAG: hypothetical protein ACK4L8_04470 [Nitrincola lacisaponensis]|uniref:hypothetical protein n=1 Tax=Nitrincola lacisaponensis TaxID=267850 RepID=UPI0039192F12